MTLGTIYIDVKERPTEKMLSDAVGMICNATQFTPLGALLLATPNKNVKIEKYGDMDFFLPYPGKGYQIQGVEEVVADTPLTTISEIRQLEKKLLRCLAEACSRYLEDLEECSELRISFYGLWKTHYILNQNWKNHVWGYRLKSPTNEVYDELIKLAISLAPDSLTFVITCLSSLFVDSKENCCLDVNQNSLELVDFLKEIKSHYCAEVVDICIEIDDRCNTRIQSLLNTQPSR